MVETFINLYICLALLVSASNSSQIKFDASNGTKTLNSKLSISQETSPFDIFSTNNHQTGHQGLNNSEEADTEEVEVEGKISQSENRYLNIYINPYIQILNSNHKIKSFLLFNIWKPPQNISS